ncbi:hypothetical protein NW762_013374 [Fusarium torreyae]|uniref:NACHT domain-containing protein n=1 Tax=Fusarium torreyae TaxID=1237075 RepID=A0A9W8RPT2_9HYPO|nr:hypothetical protein NW762_013374 [Fusarium torreyae]
MPQTHQQDSSRNLVHSLNAIGSSRVQIGNTYNTSHHYQKDAQQDCTKVLEYLGSTDPREDKIRIQQTSGGLLKDCYAWIIDNPEFLAWRDQDRETRLLWVKGDPGKGKTMLLCGIIDELHPSTKLNDPKNRISLAYFFCQATNSGLNNAASVLRGLAYLLVLQQPHLLSHFDGIQQRPTTHSNAWVAIQKRFLEVMADPALRETYFIVDALDECVENLDLLMEIISNPSSRVKWIISSRKCCDIEETLGNEQERYGLSLELNQSLISQAVKNYIDYRIERMKNRKKLEHDVVEHISMGGIGMPTVGKK